MTFVWGCVNREKRNAYRKLTFIIRFRNIWKMPIEMITQYKKKEIKSILIYMHKRVYVSKSSPYIRIYCHFN